MKIPEKDLLPRLLMRNFLKPKETAMVKNGIQ